ncbi:hypothetical protein EVAR_99794_1 [Eumeta japonica]|uniref:Uncharacterized protein n=1 Tax=Eumeta variegata TaxID=151549 RepID=A0A4C1ZE61_EUMVA|nr:hypothetical protein EVAR_99794_1 [Eumeta japonica]
MLQHELGFLFGQKAREALREATRLGRPLCWAGAGSTSTGTSPVSVAGTVAGTHAPRPAPAMPFIEDDWWPPDNEGRMVDLSTCLQDAVVAASGGGAVGELSQAELSSIVSGLALEQDSQEPDPDDILKQLGETAFDNFDTFFTDLTGAHPAHGALQQHTHHVAHAQPPIEIKQEENNNVASPPSSSQLSYNYPNSQPLSLPSGQQRLQQLLRAPGTNSSSRYNIASANPLLAEKLAATSSGIKQEPLSTDYNGTSMNYGNVSPMQRVPSGKPQVHDAGGGKVSSVAMSQRPSLCPRAARPAAEIRPQARLLLFVDAEGNFSRRVFETQPTSLRLTWIHFGVSSVLELERGGGGVVPRAPFGLVK